MAKTRSVDPVIVSAARRLGHAGRRGACELVSVLRWVVALDVGFEVEVVEAGVASVGGEVHGALALVVGREGVTMQLGQSR